MAKTKKLNPRRIPLDKSSIDPEAIKSDAAEIGLYRAWLLVANGLLELDYVSPNQITALANTVNSMEVTRLDFPRAERLTGLEVPTYTIDMKQINSQVELDKCKRRVEEIALRASLRTLCAGLMKLRGGSVTRVEQCDGHTPPCDGPAAAEPPHDEHTLPKAGEESCDGLNSGDTHTLSSSLEPQPDGMLFTNTQLDRLFTKVRPTIAEIEAGCNSYKEIEDLVVRVRDCG